MGRFGAAVLGAAVAACTGCAVLPNGRGPTGTGGVALTFDDGPSAPYTAQVLDALRDAGVRATFFVVGRNVERHPDLARRIVDEGHEIANHTHRHLYTLAFCPGTTFQDEADAGEAAIAAATGCRTRLLRYPVGMPWPNAARAETAATAADRVLVDFTVRAADVGARDPAAIAARALAGVSDGAILVLHDGHACYSRVDQAATVAALPAILRGIRARGLRVVPVGELLGVAVYREAPGDSSPVPRPPPCPEPAERSPVPGPAPEMSVPAPSPRS